MSASTTHLQVSETGWEHLLPMLPLMQLCGSQWGKVTDLGLFALSQNLWEVDVSVLILQTRKLRHTHSQPMNQKMPPG